MEMAREKEMVNINLKEALGSLFFYLQRAANTSYFKI